MDGVGSSLMRCLIVICQLGRVRIGGPWFQKAEAHQLLKSNLDQLAGLKKLV
jgi:hypothetical protein